MSDDPNRCICGASPGALHWPGCPGGPQYAATPPLPQEERTWQPPPPTVGNWEATRFICALLTSSHHRQHRQTAELIATASRSELASTMAVAVGMLHEALLHRCVQVDLDMAEYLKFLGATAANEPAFSRLPCTTRPLGDDRPVCDDCGHLSIEHNADNYCAECQRNPLTS